MGRAGQIITVLESITGRVLLAVGNPYACNPIPSGMGYFQGLLPEPGDKLEEKLN